MVFSRESLHSEMATDIDAAAVLTHLNDLGYCGITAQQLKDFMKDLKKLLKYELRQQLLAQQIEEEQKENIRILKQASYDDIFNNLYATSTVSSKAKERPKKRIIRIKVEKPEEEQVEWSGSLNDLESKQTRGIEEKEVKVIEPCAELKESTGRLGTAKEYETTDTEGHILKSSKSTSSGSKKKSTSRPKSFIKAKSFTRNIKSDPVALYHQYQESWKKLKFLDNNHRADLRWEIREKMLG